MTCLRRPGGARAETASPADRFAHGRWFSQVDRIVLPRRNRLRGPQLRAHIEGSTFPSEQLTAVAISPLNVASTTLLNKVPSEPPKAGERRYGTLPEIPLTPEGDCVAWKAQYSGGPCCDPLGTTVEPLACL